jgi:LacI family transcriptional regulator
VELLLGEFAVAEGAPIPPLSSRHLVFQPELVVRASSV